MDFYLSIEDGHVVVTDKNTNDVGTIIYTVEQYAEYFNRKADLADRPIEDFCIMSSSALDFPDEYTKSATVIDLCDAIRNGVPA